MTWYPQCPHGWIRSCPECGDQLAPDADGNIPRPKTMTEPNSRFIVKVQMPLASNADDPPALCTNEDKSFVSQLTVTDDLRAVMMHRAKAFFVAELYEGSVVLQDEVADPGW